jgi:Type VI secretion system/phage-baseplate injector OB domain
MTFFNSTMSYQPGSLAGKYSPAVVVDNNDPEKVQRIKYRIAQLQTSRPDAGLSWASPFGWSPQGNSSGVGDVGVPVIGAKVIVFFPEDDEHHAYYMADFHDKSTQISDLMENYPNSYGRVDASGNLFLVNTTTNTMRVVHVSGTYIKINADGSAEMGSAGPKVSIFSTGTCEVKALGAINLDGKTVNINCGLAQPLTITPRQRPPLTPFSDRTDY